MIVPPPHLGPTWDEIRVLFSEPYWIDAEHRTAVGSGWIAAMKPYFVHLDDYDNVRTNAVTIYHHLHSKAMPLTADPKEKWPDEALELLWTWVNQGCRRDSAEPVAVHELIPPPRSPASEVRVRKNIVDLSDAELNEYRMKLDDLEISRHAPQSPWQQVAYLHTNWCLHYQEAFLPWHRANLLYLEAMIGGPVPYWNWMSPHIAEDGHRQSGLPSAFTDESYRHPVTGELRPNPLRYAAAKDGLSKACVDKPSPTPSCRFVQRDPILGQAAGSDTDARHEKLNLLTTYQQQVRDAFAIPTFSSPQGNPGYPWANIPTFPAPDSDYTYLGETFDGTYEQPHDNYHGWVGPDMADNAYTAFDPVFWSHHAMIDLVLELWLREHPAAVYTSTCALRPFVGPRADIVDEDDPRMFVYTTIGDMCRDSRSLGYDFDALDQIRTALDRPPITSPQLYLVFQGVRCTYESYAIDIFVNQPHPAPADVVSSNPHFVLHKTHMGMGTPDQRGRCITTGVTRSINITQAAKRLDLTPGPPPAVTILVTNLRTGDQLTADEIDRVPGLRPLAVWTPLSEPAAPGESPAPAPTETDCCSATPPTTTTI